MCPTPATGSLEFLERWCEAWASVVEEDTKGKRVAYKDMHTLYEAEQKRADRLSRDEAAKELHIYEGRPTRSSLSLLRGREKWVCPRHKTNSLRPFVSLKYFNPSE